MEHISFFSSDGQPQSPERPGAVGLDAGGGEDEEGAVLLPGVSRGVL